MGRRDEHKLDKTLSAPEGHSAVCTCRFETTARPTRREALEDFGRHRLEMRHLNGHVKAGS